MTEEEKFLFDLNGFLVVEDLLSPDQVGAMNEAIDANRDDDARRSEPALSNCTALLQEAGL